MWHAAVLMASALAGPNGLQALHNPQTEHTQQQLMVDRLGGTIDAMPKPSSKPADPAAEKRAAAWRADHLTCASRKGRTRAQFQAECKPTPDADEPSS